MYILSKLLSLVDMKSALSRVTSWVTFWNEFQNSEEGEIYGHWGISLCTCGWVHSLVSDWLLAQEWTYWCIYVPAFFFLVLAWGLYWIKACFIFVCQLDTIWDCWTDKLLLLLFCSLEQQLLEYCDWSLKLLTMMSQFNTLATMTPPTYTNISVIF